MNAGFDHHLTKPVDVAALLQLIAAAQASRAQVPHPDTIAG